MKALNDLILITEYAERGIAAETAEKRLKVYNTRPGDMFENRDTGEQFVVYGISTCNRLMGIGLNYDHSGYVYKENCKRISYKDIRPFKAKDEVPTKEEDSIQKENTLPDITPERSAWLNSAEASKYINRERTVIAKLAKRRKIKFTRAPNTKKLMFHRRWLDAYIMGYGPELTTEEEAELEKLNRY
ncbi:MAG: hypothetical protein HON27_00080 [Candidatus Marinimicrobia bacterium]|nr:hypothetical protein [Candidatus Neomarinimicrobiota bacterium]MBT5271545.1 hypothetical protein [Candidatus Neomarinimicrobiota bacterium]